MAIHPDQAMTRELSEMCEAGMSIREMAAKLFVSHDVMKRLLRECGLHSRNTGNRIINAARGIAPLPGDPYRSGLSEDNDPLLDALKSCYPHRRYPSLVMKKLQ